eukprot:scaffold59238_cov27-Tisochrysis_lutea.AAC.9
MRREGSECGGDALPALQCGRCPGHDGAQPARQVEAETASERAPLEVDLYRALGPPPPRARTATTLQREQRLLNLALTQERGLKRVLPSRPALGELAVDAKSGAMPQACHGRTPCTRERTPRVEPRPRLREAERAKGA